jgi:hypothetical protein
MKERRDGMRVGELGYTDTVVCLGALLAAYIDRSLAEPFM